MIEDFWSLIEEGWSMIEDVWSLIEKGWSKIEDVFSLEECLVCNDTLCCCYGEVC